MKPKRTLLRSQLIWAIVSMLLVAFPALAQIVNTREVSAVFLVPDHTIYGTTTYSCEVDVTPTVSPYIDSSHGGSFSLSGTLNVSSSVYSVSGIQDAGVGVVLFGQNGTVGSTSNPFQGSTITIASPDYWYSGTYQAIVNDYNSQAPFTLNFGITGGPFSLSISPNNNSPITLNGPSGNGQILMADAATAPPGHTRYSGVFASGEGITLESFQILEGANGGEIGNITLTIPLTGGHTWYNYSTLSPVLDSLTTGQTITVPLSYVRGDKIPPPTVQATASAYQINPGQAITLSVTVNNPSQVVPIAGGQVTISSYGPTLTNATGQSSVTNFGVISPQSSQTYYFHIAGSQAGTVAPLVQLTYQYGYPATAKTTLPINASVPNITVTPQTGSLYVTISPAGANNAGAQWQVDNNGVWHNSGTTISGLSVGGHTISFNTISGWNSPANQNVTINNGSTTTTTGTYVQQTGSLQVTISPSGAVSAGAQWQVDNGAWQNSGATVSGLQLGSHTVSFSTISGWTTPASQPVTISANQTAQPTGTYVVASQTGSLEVTISPSGAVSAGAQWQVDAGAWQNSGATISGLSVGSHTVSFSTISGWTTPASQPVTISANQTAQPTGTYVVASQTGSLEVTISPSGAVSAGAQWQVDGGAWQNSGATVSGLSVSSHTVSFSTISGWTTPASQPVTISANQTAQPTGTYVVASQTGSLEVTISPSGAVSAGAQWQVDAGAWQNSGATISGLSVGSHTVSFNTIGGWSTPTNQVATVSVNQTTQITGTYAPIPQLSVSPSTGLSASGFEGGPYTPSSLQYLLNNTATGTLNWTVSADQPWVTVSQSSGQNAGTVTVSINTNANSLVPNTYYSTLTFGGNGGSTNFQVELTIFSSGQFFIFPTCINGLQIDINGGTYAPPGGQVTNIVWNWGDGQQAPGGFPNSHTYSSAGNYTVQVTSQYSDGSSATLSQTLTVAPGALQNCVACEISASQNGAVSYQASVGSGTVSAGTSVTLQQANEADMLLTASPNSNDFFLDWSPSSGMTGINATPVTTNSPSVFIVVNNNSQIIGNFSPLSLGIGLPPWGSNGFNLLLYAPAGSNVVVQVSTNLVNWYTWTNVTIPYSPYPISDLSVTNSKYRFYRVLLSSSAIVAAQALQSYGTGSAATSMSLPAGGQLYVYGVATGGATALGAFANGQTIQITNADGIISAQLAATTNSSNNYTTSTSYHVLGGVGASGFNYAQGFYGVNLGPGPNLNASVQFTLTVPAMIAVIGMGSSQTELTLSGVGNPTIDVPVQTDVSGTEALIIAHQYLTAGTYTIQETTGDGPPIQDPNHEVDLIGVLIFSSSPNAATSSNPQIPLPPGF